MSMLFGLAVGLSVAAAVYMKDRRDDGHSAGRASAPTEPASLKSAIDENGETGAAQEAPAKKEEPRFTFYDLLPNFEVVHVITC